MSKKKQESQYYTIKLEKALNMLIDADRCSRMFSTNVKLMIDKYSNPDSWDDSAIPDYMDGYLNAKTLKDFLHKKVHEPDEKLVEYAKLHKVEGVMLTKNDLGLLQSLVYNLEETKTYLQKTYGFNTLLN